MCFTHAGLLNARVLKAIIGILFSPYTCILFSINFKIEGGGARLKGGEASCYHPLGGTLCIQSNLQKEAVPCKNNFDQMDTFKCLVFHNLIHVP